ncbi:hypothetical protein HKX17_05505 [Sulfitobacter sp. KE34]|uniref:Uncharacterized protein n=1 Tax=Sulfitobacter faviae TaxID=1775881 RepID=A0AAX3LNB2_9RHOB|nr:MULTISPECIES: hypothetical protein [Sulfitobacter]MDF3375248.1 hypothetical protein [Sulfitobacter sp. KE37]MDF3436396.1 hypothetical protein [Sulfitobacter sp. Ks46]MDF3353282.1 hypothetical protein [Sulfitobacter sp. KE27]MDF3356929.1 hypothetical protein [Sulfitobacter sp. KE33]MDF3362162.1 hypothetical protein [Sulfitobacter sp. Ks41]
MGLTVLAGAGCSAAIVQGRIIYGKNKAKKDGFRALKDRLDDYALMQNMNPTDHGDNFMHGRLPIRSSRPILSPGSHKILLGVLKKIEAKNAVAMGVVFLLLGGMWSIAGDVRDYDPWLSFAFAAIIGFLVGPLFAGLDGVGHLGQSHYLKLEKENRKREPRPEWYMAQKMQHRLMLDLVAKEYGFQAKIFSIALAVFAVIALVIFSFSAESKEKRPLLTIEVSFESEDA